MGSTILFTHLKIILLQYFQFSIFNKINNIQMDLCFLSDITIIIFVYVAKFNRRSLKTHEES